jgi:hypothetical protein
MPWDNLWSDERTASLRRLVREGLTDPEIADRLGVTVRAVIGKRHRLALKANPRRRGGVLVARTLPMMDEGETL